MTAFLCCRPSAATLGHSQQAMLPTKIQPITRTSQLASHRIKSTSEGAKTLKAVVQCVAVDDDNDDFLPEL